MFIGNQIIDTALTPILSVDEEAFLNVYKSLENLEMYQKQRIELLKINAAKKLSKVEKKIIEMDYDPLIWKALLKEDNKNIRLFKQNFKERLLPSILQGNEDSISKVCSIIEKFAKYLLNPTVSELEDLNKSMLELPYYQQIIPSHNLFKHPYMHKVYIFTIFCISGVSAYYLSKYLGSSNDSAITNGIYIFGVFIAGYMALIIKSR